MSVPSVDRNFHTKYGTNKLYFCATRRSKIGSFFIQPFRYARMHTCRNILDMIWLWTRHRVPVTWITNSYLRQPPLIIPFTGTSDNDRYWYPLFAANGGFETREASGWRGNKTTHGTIFWRAAKSASAHVGDKCGDREQAFQREKYWVNASITH